MMRTTGKMKTKNVLALAMALLLSLSLLIRWEYHVFRYPQHFWRGSNCSLRCGSCTERLCRAKLYPPLNED